MGYLREIAARHLAESRLAASFCTAVIAAVVSGWVASTLFHELRMLRTSAIAKPYPVSIYKPMPTPGTSPVPGSPGAAGGDFSQVYTSALALRHGESAYRPTTERFQDHWHRPPGFPPLMNWVAVPYTLLDYPGALLLHTALGFAGLIAATAFVLWMAGLRRHIVRVALTQACLYFLTPIGVTHLERGQFELIVGASCALSVGLVFLPRWLAGSAAITGFLGALKWTSIAFLGCFSALGFLLGRGRRRWAFFAIPVVTAICTLPFWQGLGEYWTTIRIFEIEATPTGLTLQHILPRSLARAAPVVVTLAVAGLALLRYRGEEDREVMLTRVSAPFSIALMSLSVCFGTLSYEYHTVATMGLIPGIVLWAERTTGIPAWVKAVACAAFCAFLVITYRIFGVGTLLSAEFMSMIYAGFSLLFVALTAGIVVGTRPGLANGSSPAPPTSPHPRP